jgi:hypothetical protein
MEELMTYKIDKDIPVSTHNGRTRSKWAGLVKQMKVGDSVLVKDRRESQALYYQLKANKRKAATRRWGKGFRVWRVG